MRFWTKLTGQAAALATVTGVLVTVGALPGEAANPTLPVETASGTNYDTADPGVLLDGGHFYAFSTGAGLREFNAPEAGGPWTAPVQTLSGALPSWADSSKALWDPDMIKTTSGAYVVYFAAALTGTAGNPAGNDAAPASGSRCIGTAVGTSPTGPFTAAAKPLVCFAQYSPADNMDGDPGNRVRGEGVIGVSPVFVTIDSQVRLYVLYKTQADPGAGEPSTIRMVRVSDSDGTSVLGDSHQLMESNTGSFADTIEAPSLIQNGSWFVLFVAHGNFDSCGYSTEWFKSQNIWGWAGSTASTFLDSAQAGICGPGTADVTNAEVAGQSRIFFNGWVNEANGTITSTPYSGSGSPVEGTNAARVMYSAVINWGSDGTPALGEYLN